MYVRHEKHVLCSYAFYVLVRFDEDHRLADAQGTGRRRGCK